MKFLVTVYDDSPQLGDARNPSILLAKMNVILNFKNNTVPLIEREEWIKFKNMVINTYSGSYISIEFDEEKTVYTVLERF
jgi:hypothetical protein